GFMGIGFIRLLRLRGVGRIVGVDPRDDARMAAIEAGADAAYDPEDLPDHLRLTRYEDWPGTRGVDLAIEASGTQAGLTLAGELVQAHGTLAILASHGTREVVVGMWNWKAIDVVNAHVRDPRRLHESMRVGIELLESGQFDFSPLVTHRYPLADIGKAFTDLRGKPNGFIKAVLDIPGSLG
ncbi:MAG TPA: zinc-binding dehydrogenase, partial [Candidatus Saccharimonadales bacterium]|nr:zinc-binding dehydrogenase [Candidatus Saccharimonadales bacterium]